LKNTIRPSPAKCSIVPPRPGSLVEAQDVAELGAAQFHGAFDDGLQHLVEIEHGAPDRLQHLAHGALGLERPTGFDHERRHLDGHRSLLGEQ
jgi:hypothetical protein